jgi:alanine racemase
MVSTPTPLRSDPRTRAAAATDHPLSAALRPAWVDVDLDALERNAARMRARVRPARLLAVLKADAYGHGAPRVGRLLEEAGVDRLGVALLEEGAELRRAGVALPILVLGTAQPSQLPLFARYRLTPTVSSLDQLALWRGYTAAGGAREPQPIHLKVDTGMNRLGVARDEVAEALATLRATPGLRLDGLISHLAEADDPESASNRRQEERFAELLALLTAEERRRVAVHLANSAGALHRPASRHDLVRLGLSLYGLDPAGARAPAADGDEALEPVMSITSRIVQLRRLEPGAALGYGGRWVASRPSRIAVVPVGYADGYAWRLGRDAGATALVGGRRVPVAGAVSMDMLTLDVTDLGEGGDGAALGDEVVLLGRQGGETITAWELAAAAGTIPYELLCLLGLRLPRRYFRHGRLEEIVSRFSEVPG